MTKHQGLLALFEAHKNSDKAQAMSAYMRNQFVYYGIQTPERCRLYKTLIARDQKAGQADWLLLEKVWASPHRECQYFVCDYLTAFQKFLTFKDISKIEKFARSKQWWDTIDQFDRIIGRIGLTDNRVDQLMLDWSLDHDFWIRRLAIDHQLTRKEKTNPQLLSQIILNNLGSKEFFINKAIGWSLRDYAKTDPDWVRHFIKEHEKELAPLSLREASRHL